MNNFFCNHKTQKSDPEHTFSEIDINYRRDYSKGKSFKVSIWNEVDTYNNDDFIQDFVIYNQSLWARIDRTPSTNEVPTEGPWAKVMDGVSDVQFKEEGNKIFWKYEDESEWKDLFELDVVSESEIRNMLKDIATDVDSNFYDKTLSETSINAVQNKVITQALNKKADKTELSKKQDVISDLSEIRRKAETALQSVPSEYITEAELNIKNFATKSDVALVNTSLNNTNAKFVDYYTKDQANVKFQPKGNYLTEHQDISGKQDKITDLAQIRSNAQKGATALQFVPEKYATKIDVSNEVAKIVNSAPKAFDTLKEIADWIEEDAEPAIVLANKVEQKADKTDVAEALANKAEKDEIPTKMSQLEQDIEIGGEVDLSDYPTREEVSETYLPREEFNEVSERFASADRVQELSKNVTELSTQVSGLSERVDELGNPVFKAVYGETTFEEIKAAYDSGKVVHCDYNSLCYVLSRITANGAYFAAVNAPYAYRMDCTSSSLWTNRVIELEVTSNKVTSLSDKSTDTQYPSAKAVYDFVQSQSGGGGGTSSDKQGVVSQTLNYNSADNTYSVSNVVRGSIPSFFIDLVTEAGASFNAESGYFSLNGIDNIAYDEMRTIYDCRTGYGTNSLLAVYGKAYTARTNFVAFRGYGNSYANHEPTTIYTKYLCDQNASITKFALCSEVALYVRAGSGNNFEALGLGGRPLDRSKLEEIIGIIDVTNLTGSANFFYNGAYQPWLTSFQLKSLKASIDLSGMPRLSEATILYMINNEKATAAITIKLHADAKTMADASEAIQAALASHPNVTLAK